MATETKRRKLILGRARSWYKKYERPLSSLSLISGFVFDAATLKRVDLFWENFWIVVHLLGVAVCIILINRGERGEMDTKDPDRIHFWLVNALQFLFGGLLSVFLVFYFRSGALSVSWPFLLILVGAFVANESLKKNYARLVFQVAFFFVSLFSFAIFLVPVVFHTIGPTMFLASGGVSIVGLGVFLFILQRFNKEKFTRSARPILLLVLSIFLVINGLYFLKLIPPIPLSLKDADVFHSLVNNGPGNYTVLYEKQGFFGFLSWSDNVHLVLGSPLYVYSAVFSPTSLNIGINHEWQWYDEAGGVWVTKSKVPLSVFGGRDGGYKTYSMKTGLLAGKWRVNIETERGEVIGRLRFNIIPVSTEPILKKCIIS